MIEVEISGEQEMEASLAAVSKGLQDTRTPLETADRTISKRLAERLRAGGTPAYPDVKPETRKRRHGDKSAPPLMDTGDLLAQVLSTGNDTRGIVRAVNDIAPDGLTKGVEGPSVLRLQNGFQGTDSKGRKIDQPPRPFLTVTDDDEETFISEYQKYVDGLLEKF